MKTKVLVPAAVALMALSAGVWAWQRSGRQADSAFLLASGRIEGRITSLAARSAGRVAEIKGEEGRAVGRGEVLARLADPALHERIHSMEARVRRFQVGLAQAERDLARHQELVKAEAVAEQDLERSRLEVELQRAALREARAALAEQQRYLEEMTVRAPIDGTVLIRTVELGEWLQPGAPLFTLVDLNQLHLKIYVPEPEIGKLALGQEARVHVDAYPGRAFPARLSKVASEAEFTPKNVETREERVKLVFAVELTLAENPGGVLKPGMPADAVVRLAEGPDWITPSASQRKLFQRRP